MSKLEKINLAVLVVNVGIVVIGFVIVNSSVTAWGLAGTIAATIGFIFSK